MNAESVRQGERLCWVLIGPTASGKSAVALELAIRHGLEVVSVDSMQVYRHMDIGTAKPTPRDRALVPHHMIDVLEPEESCNAGWFCRKAAEAIESIWRRGRRPLIIAGTPLYLKALLWGLADAPPRDPQVRARLLEEAARRGPAALHERLVCVDPESARRIHPNDVQRLVRALEVFEVTGRPASAGQGQFKGTPRVPHVMVGLGWPRQALYARIERRVDEMMARGLLDEVRALQGRLGPQARQALGYKELLEFIEGKVGLAESVRAIKRNTRRYAKHQLTWFRQFPHARWVDAARAASVGELANKCEAVLAAPP